MGGVEPPRVTWMSIVGPARSKRALSSARRAAVKDMTRRQTATFRTIICGLEMRTGQDRVADPCPKRRTTFADGDRMAFRCCIRLVGDSAETIAVLRGGGCVWDG